MPTNQVRVLQDNQEVRSLYLGEHFGEGALLEAYNIRTATCKAMTQVTCATLDRDVGTVWLPARSLEEKWGGGKKVVCGPLDASRGQAFLRYIIPLEALGRLSYLGTRWAKVEGERRRAAAARGPRDNFGRSYPELRHE
jgi:hypothetical protein